MNKEVTCLTTSKYPGDLWLSRNDLVKYFLGESEDVLLSEEIRGYAKMRAQYLLNLNGTNQVL
jgi:hypothetical protein